MVLIAIFKKDIRNLSDFGCLRLFNGNQAGTRLRLFPQPEVPGIETLEVLHADVLGAFVQCADEQFVLGARFSFSHLASATVQEGPGFLEGQATQAFETYSLMARYPFVANSKWFQGVIRDRLDQAANELPAAEVEAAREKAESMDVWKTVQQWLEDTPAACVMGGPGGLKTV